MHRKYYKIVFLCPAFLSLICIAGCRQINDRGHDAVRMIGADSSRVFLDHQISKIVEIPKSDLKNFRTWEYKILVLKPNETAAISDTLNRLGDDRWDCFWVENADTGKILYLKKAPLTVTEYLYGIKP